MNWATILTADQLDAMWRGAPGKPGDALRARSWWESRTLPQLHGELAGAWDCNHLTNYVIARSYIALRAAAERELVA